MAWLQEVPQDYKIIMDEYSSTNKLSVNTKNAMKNIVVDELMKKFGDHPPKEAFKAAAEGIMRLFPSLKNPKTPLGYVSHQIN